MSSVNKATILGRLGQDPDIRYANNGNCCANLSVATSEKWKDKNTGNQQEKTEWHRVTIWGKLAELAGQYLKKGSQVYLEGQLQTRKWQDKDGNDRWTTEIVLSGYGSKMVFCGGNQGNGQGRSPEPPAAASPTAVAGQMGGGTIDAGEAGSQWFPKDKGEQVEPKQQDFDDDIPF